MVGGVLRVLRSRLVDERPGSGLPPSGCGP